LNHVEGPDPGGSFKYPFVCQDTVPRPRDSEGTFSIFESSCNLLLPV